MPLYEYFCPPCNSKFEVLRPMSQMDSAAVCPSGHTTNNRVLSIFAQPARSNTSVATMDRLPMAGGDACCSTDGMMGGHSGCSCC